ncbi:MAG: hypothetical protein ACRENG_16715, partial [bacterium]
MVAPSNGPGHNEDLLAQTIIADSTGRRNALPQKTVYVLKRDGVYPMVSLIINRGFVLHIKAEDGPGLPPFLTPRPTAANTYNAFFNFRKDAILENLELDQLRPSGDVNNRAVQVFDKASLWVKGCVLSHDRGAALTLASDSCSIYIYDSIFHSHGHPKSIGGNGRVVDVRSTTYSDSIVIQNTTFFGLTDRVIRNQGSQVGYTLIDHCTGWTTQGFHGYIELSNTHHAVITNNLFYNPIGMGSRFFKVPNALAEQNQPAPENRKFWVVSLDNLYQDSKFAIKNNNIVWEQRFIDLWAQTDSVETPGTITPTLLATLDNPANAYFSELVAFKTLPPNNPDGTNPDPYIWIQAYLQNRNLTTYPENWFFGLYTEFDFSYGTTAQSYSAAAGGFPVGDLNWYPDRKAAWIAAGMPTSVAESSPGTPNTFELAQNYPNPFNPEPKIAYKLAKT